MFRSTSQSRDYIFVGLAGLAALGVARVLPRTLLTLSPTVTMLVPCALAFMVAVAWLAVFRPRTAFIVAFALMGFVRFEPAPVDAVFAVLIIASFTVGAARPRVPAVIGLPVAVFVVVSLLSMVNAVDMQRAIKFEFITLYGVALAVWLSWAFSNEGWTEVAMKTYVIVATVSAILAPLALYTPLPDKHLLLFGDVRAQGLFKDPNVFAPFLIPAAVIVLEELSSPRVLRWRRPLLAAIFGLLGVGIVLAYSRAAWLNLALAVGTLVIVLTSRQGGFKRAARSVVVIAVAAAAGFGVLVASGSLSYFQERSHLQGYDQERFSNQGSALDDTMRHVFGYGPGQSEVRLPISTHSTFARTSFEQGLLGVTCFALMLLGTLVCAFLLARRRIDVNGIGTASLLGIWIGLTANSAFIDTLHWRHLWVFAGLIWYGYTSTLGSAARTRPTHQTLP